MQMQEIERQSDGWLEMPSPGVDALRRAMEQYYPELAVRRLRTIAIVGAAGEGRRLAELCAKHGIDVVAHADDSPAKIGTTIGSRTVKPVAELDDLDRHVPVAIASHRVLGASECLRAMGFRTVLPFAALQVMTPDLFPPHMFYDGLLDDLAHNRDQYQWLYDAVADERSRDVLKAVVAFRQTLDAATLKPVLDNDDLYAPKGLIRFSDHEVYVDGGSFDGDTIRSFIERVNGRFTAVYAFEPDPVTFKTLQANFALEPRVHPFHAGLYSQKGSLRFRDDASRGAIFAADGEIEMPVTTIDATVGDEPVTYVKMNIEGAEIDALNGARRAIERWHPKLALSVYHRASDLWRIPRLVRELSAEYDLYLRQHDGGIIETVLYALARA
jgi:FkbM family methyltransferase